MKRTRDFIITVRTDFPDAEELIQKATEKIACELGWGDDCTTSIEAVERPGPGQLDRYIVGWEMEPSEDPHPEVVEEIFGPMDLDQLR